MTGRSRRAHTRAVALVTTGVTAAVLAGCSAGADPEGTSNGDGAGLTVGMALAPPTLDLGATDAASVPQALLTNVYEGLVRVDQNGRITGSLAKAWQVSPDRSTYTFELVDNAKFSNGAVFTPEDVKFSVERAKNRWTNAAAATMRNVKDVKILSGKTVQIVLEKPSNDWLYRMAATRAGAMFSRTGVTDLAKKPVGTGPYTVSKWVPGQSLTLNRNPDYWGQRPHYERVTFKYMTDTSALTNAMLSGGINILSVVQPDALPRFSDTGRFRTIEGTTNGEVVLSFNNAKGAFADKAVRQAARAAIDHRSLLDKCWGGKGTLIGSMVPPTDPWYEDLTGVAPYDPDKAKSLLADAKKPHPAIRLRIPNAPYAVSCGPVVKSQLEQVGFTVTMDTMEFPTWLTKVFQNSDYDASIVAHVEPRDIGTVFGNSDYYLHYQNSAVTDDLTAADTGDETTQITKMKEAAKIISEDAAADWLFLMPNLMVTDTSVAGLAKNQLTESFDLTALSRD
ncbi:HTH-type transcriptional regulator SgrR [Austwickia sp. TVS 96-490-7B]|uniref:ABC transporter substrate-binding protein n=1 Tax=Austwickia sp. TVS 96-490-7B TaxID=2830843 RepID=UPI001C58227A|nr:ABC transporter substrate-binding protein [Austwickia sp. TVS 96-490-7B]MBW3086458.1 HTH-type transcriptional regulator SgrR [Austwickia sp. TVS 96-490-7B]